MKKALIFDPYLDTLGGGEFYCLNVASYLIKHGFEVEIAWRNKNILNQITQRFGLNFKNRVKINSKAFFILKEKGNLLKKYLFTKNYQLIFFLSDGSLPFLFAEKNFIHFQVPFKNINKNRFLNKIKLRKINKIICNSFFTKRHIDKEFNLNSSIVYPPLSEEFLELKKNPRKENIILSVGRFDEMLNAKKQDVLIKAFRKMVDKGLKDWQLILLGGLLRKNNEFEKLEHLAKGYPIKIKTNVSFKTLVNYYQKAKIYWHAVGYGEDLKRYPERAEHFGISIIEAMSNGCVPIVYNGGGVSEVINNKINGYFWKSLNELKNLTFNLINNESRLKKISLKAKNGVKKFRLEKFNQRLSQIFK